MKTAPLFFFSSRRRHTRCSRDWSSDVCSSDLSVVSLNTKKKHRSEDRPLQKQERRKRPLQKSRDKVQQKQQNKSAPAKACATESCHQDQGRAGRAVCGWRSLRPGDGKSGSGPRQASSKDRLPAG